MNFKSIRNFFKTEEKKKKIPINQQTKFIETYSNNLINFVYKSNLCKNKIITNYLYNAKQYIYPNLTLEEYYTRPIKKTEISIRNNNQKTLTITNIQPEWDEELQIYTFKNWGRIRAKSTKNTQFVDKNNNIIAIFGRLEFEDEYVLDFKNMSLIQAISLAITCLNK